MTLQQELAIALRGMINVVDVSGMHYSPENRAALSAARAALDKVAQEEWLAARQVHLDRLAVDGPSEQLTCAPNERTSNSST